MKKSKLWFGFYAAMVIIAIALFIILFPIFNKKDEQISPQPSNNFEDGPDGKGNGNDEPSLAFKISSLDMTDVDKLFFGEELVQIDGNIKFNSIEFVLSFDGESVENELSKIDEEGEKYCFSPSRCGNYTLSANFENETFCSLGIIVAKNNSTMPMVRLGDAPTIFSLVGNQQISKLGDGLQLTGENLHCTKAGVKLLYTQNNKGYYSTETQHSIFVMPKISLCKTAPFFVDKDFHADVNLELRKAVEFNFYIDFTTDINMENNFVPEPDDILLETDADVDTTFFFHPDYIIALNDMSIENLALQLSIKYDGVVFTFDVNITFV